VWATPPSSRSQKFSLLLLFQAYRSIFHGEIEYFIIVAKIAQQTD
jgi:hypothetical protein